MKLFFEGRKGVFKTLENFISKEDKTIWMHCASLGEYEQGVPLLESFKQNYSSYKVIVTFFSPSGYEIKKNTPLADQVVYLPLDTPNNAKRFLQIVHPSLAVFVKYEFWPNYLFQLHKTKTQTLLVSGLFRENQIFFKSYGSFMRKALKNIHHFFVQNKSSKKLLESIHFTNVSISGDTRFDRVANQLKQDNRLNFIQEFKQDVLCLVCGSTWPEDDAVLLDFINTSSKDVKIIIAPHKMDLKNISDLRKNIHKPSVLYSEKENKDLSTYSVFILDTIGLLSKVYSYADIAYVGGAMGSTGLHNILEPITFGTPTIIGKNYKNFPEAEGLLKINGLYSITTSAACSDLLNKLVSEKEFREKTGAIAKEYANQNIGATQKIENYISKLNL